MDTEESVRGLSDLYNEATKSMSGKSLMILSTTLNNHPAAIAARAESVLTKRQMLELAQQLLNLSLSDTCDAYDCALDRCVE